MSANAYPLTPEQQRLITSSIVDWYRPRARPLPWRATSDPYLIWISEIMLQQTRVDQALPYFLRFAERFPTVEQLAAAPLDEVLVAWEGLGYYSRARNLHRAAQLVAQQHAGKVPDTYKTIRTLPGVGPYTAAAVLSIAFNQPHAVLDGNVMRVLSRYGCIEDDISSARTRSGMQATADRIIDVNEPGLHNQGMMELGATVCTPRSPACSRCPLRSECGALASGRAEFFPVKKEKRSCAASRSSSRTRIQRRR